MVSLGNLFGGAPEPPTPPASAEPPGKYTLQNVHALLDEIGQLRLRVQRAEMKLLVSQVAWGTQHYLDRCFTPGPPPGRVVAQLQEQLAMIRSIVSTYIAIQDNPDQYTAKGDIGQLLENGRASLRKYCEAVSAEDASPDITNYVVDTTVLSSTSRKGIS